MPHRLRSRLGFSGRLSLRDPVADVHDRPLRSSLVSAYNPFPQVPNFFSEFMIGEVEVVPEVVDERRPFVRIDVMATVL
jgi:hypothetical protein